jgi:hypothetical protein
LAIIKFTNLPLTISIANDTIIYGLKMEKTDEKVPCDHRRVRGGKATLVVVFFVLGWPYHSSSKGNEKTV